MTNGSQPSKPIKSLASSLFGSRHPPDDPSVPTIFSQTQMEESQADSFFCTPQDQPIPVTKDCPDTPSPITKRRKVLNPTTCVKVAKMAPTFATLASQPRRSNSFFSPLYRSQNMLEPVAPSKSGSASVNRSQLGNQGASNASQPFSDQDSPLFNPSQYLSQSQSQRDPVPPFNLEESQINPSETKTIPKAPLYSKKAIRSPIRSKCQQKITSALLTRSRMYLRNVYYDLPRPRDGPINNHPDSQEISQLDTDETINLENINKVIPRIKQGNKDLMDSTTVIHNLCATIFQRPKYHLEFEELGILGQGDFSVVKKALNRLNGGTYAVKMSKKSFRGDAHRLLAVNEVFVLDKLMRPTMKGNLITAPLHIVSYYGSWFEEAGQVFFIQMEYCDRGSLEYYLSSDFTKKLNATCLIKIMLHVARGLSHVHAHGIAHMDVKPGNIFQSCLEPAMEPPMNLFFDSNDSQDLIISHRPNDFQVDDFDRLIFKLGDFGLACSYDGTNSHEFEGDARYLAPEILAGDQMRLDNHADADDNTDTNTTTEKNLSRKKFGPADLRCGDIFSLGATMIELLLQKRFEKGDDIWQLIRSKDRQCQEQLLLRLKKNCDHSALLDVITQCIQHNPWERPNADQICTRLANMENSTELHG